MFSRLGDIFGFGSYLKHVSPGIPTGNGTMDFSIVTGDDMGLWALMEDI